MAVKAETQILLKYCETVPTSRSRGGHGQMTYRQPIIVVPPLKSCAQSAKSSGALVQ